MVDVPEVVKVVGLDIKYDLIFRIKGKKAVDILTCFGYEVAADPILTFPLMPGRFPPTSIVGSFSA